jgi:uncharacterized integral membrane protein
VTEPTNQHPPSVRDLEATPIPLPAPNVPRRLAGRSAPAVQRPHRLPRSRAGGLWVVLVAFALVLLLLMIFVLQNGGRFDVYYLGAHGRLPMGVALLLAAIFGVLLVAVPTGVRIGQLRLIAARHRSRTAVAPRRSAGS